MKHSSKPWLMLQLAVLLVGMAFTMTSCGDDEPSGKVIDYYLNVEEKVLVNGVSDQADRYYNPVTRMREAIRKVYPTPNTTGADEEVIAACDNEYLEYTAMYTGLPDHITCLFHLVRVVKDGTRVVQSERLKTYAYDINNEPSESED